jgi:alpha-L-fucosidase
MPYSNRLLQKNFLQITILCLLLASTLLPLHAQTSSPDAPTAGKLTPHQIDEIWIKANSRYDPERKAILADVQRGDFEGPFRPDWQSLSHYQAPEWYQDAKFGIFIHWGIYSVPAFGSEWYSRNMYVQGTSEYKHHIATYGPQSKFGYKDFIPMFKAEHWDPNRWAKLFKESGAKYVVPVAEHHDGFAMYESNLTDWCAGKMGPKRDIIGELEKAVRAEGLHFGVSSHRAEHDWFMGGGREFASDVNDPKYAAFYGPALPHYSDDDKNWNDLEQDWTHVSNAYMNDWVARTAELVQRYHPDLIYFDWWIGQPSYRNHLSEFAAYYYNQGAARGTGAVIDYKYHDMADHSGTLDIERGQLTGIRSEHWQTDTSISDKSWGYIQNDTYKSADVLIHQLIDIVSKNGNLLLNIGPRADGTIPEAAQKTLLDMGAWLKINGDAIYGTRHWKIYGEGPTKVEGGAFHDTDTKLYTAQDFRFTSKGATLYAIEMGWPTDGKAVIHSLGTSSLGAASKVKSVALLGSNATIGWQQEKDGLHLQLPPKPAGEYAYSFRILLQ